MGWPRTYTLLKQTTGNDEPSTMRRDTAQRKEALTMKRKQVANTVVAFLAELHPRDANINFFELHLAFEYAYEPTPRFWRDIDLTTVIETIRQRFPTCLAETTSPNAISGKKLLKQALDANAFDEANAEMMMALPACARPDNWHDAANWIFEELEKRGRLRKLEYAERDGGRCGEEALMVVRCLETAACGASWTRIGTDVARDLRRRRMAELEAAVIQDIPSEPSTPTKMPVQGELAFF
jgi:hypothetical protein